VKDIERFRAEVQLWLEANCPLSMRTPITSAEMLWSGSAERLPQRGPAAVVRAHARPRLVRARLAGRIRWRRPERREQRVLEQEMAALGCRQPQYNLGIWMLGPVLLELGTEALKREHLPPMARGTVRWCQGFSEPNAGSDLASLRTSAVRDGEHFVVNGQKIWTSYGNVSDWMYALVRTDPTAKKQQGISFVLIDMSSPGVTVRPIELISGKSSFCEVFFDNVRVPVHNLVGELNGGWTVAKKLLDHERAAMAKFTEGGAPSHDALAVARPYLADAEPVWRDRLAGVLMDGHAFALTARRLHEMAMGRQDVSGGCVDHEAGADRAGGGEVRTAAADHGPAWPVVGRRALHRRRAPHLPPVALHQDLHDRRRFVGDPAQPDRQARAWPAGVTRDEPASQR
jgi:acyl-CoA dehydrogenase